MQNNQPTLDQAGSKDSACPPRHQILITLFIGKIQGVGLLLTYNFTESLLLAFRDVNLDGCRPILESLQYKTARPYWMGHSLSHRWQ